MQESGIHIPGSWSTFLGLGCPVEEGQVASELERKQYPEVSKCYVGRFKPGWQGEQDPVWC